MVLLFQIKQEHHLFRSEKDCPHGSFTAAQNSCQATLADLTRSELGDSLSSFRNGVLGQFTWKNEADRGLNLAGSNSWLLVVASQVASLNSDLVKDILH